MLLADSTTRFLPPFSPSAIVGVLAAAAVGVVLLAWLLGPSNPVARRTSLWVLRGSILLLIFLLLLNPVRVENLPGPVQRPELFYLIDSSASMQMGNPRSRWDEVRGMIAAAGEEATLSAAVVKPFRFGQRLAAIERPEQIGLAAAPATPGENRAPRTVSPHDGDTRLQAALKQISSRFGRIPPVGIVVFSDGRVHDESGLEQVAADFARLNVPIHVAPVGDIGKGGDVAIAAVVAPPRVRKYTEVEVQVFLRSFGFDGKRAEVELLDVGQGQDAPRRLTAPLPITLQSGFQSVSLSFRTDLSTRKLRISIPSLADEVSDKNNQLDTEMAIDRTKIRVLYVEGSSQPISLVRIGDRAQYRGPFSDLKQALTDDEDIECVVLAAPGGVGRLTRMAEYAQADGVRGFPTTVAELSAFDAIILSDVAAEAFTQTQLEWLKQWIGQRGGGLCMVGGEHSFASGGWDQTVVAAMLPVEMLPGGADWVPGETIRITPELPPSPHPLWSLVADDKQNRQIVAAFPQIIGVNRLSGAQANLATVLATTEIAGAPLPAEQATTLSLRSFTTLMKGLVAQAPRPKPPWRAVAQTCRPSWRGATAAAGRWPWRFPSHHPTPTSSCRNGAWETTATMASSAATSFTG